MLVEANILLLLRLVSLLMGCFVFLYPVTVRAQDLVKVWKFQCASEDNGMRPLGIFFSSSSVNMVKLKNAMVSISAVFALVAVLVENSFFKFSTYTLVFFIVALAATSRIVSYFSSDIDPFLKEELLERFAFSASSAYMSSLIGIVSAQFPKSGTVPQNEFDPRTKRFYLLTAPAFAQPLWCFDFLFSHGESITAYTGLINAAYF